MHTGSRESGRDQDRGRKRESHARKLARAIALSAIVTAIGCQQEVADLDGAFYDGDHRLVHCGVNLDTSARNSIDSVDSGLDRALDRNEVVELYTHHPGFSVPIDKIEHVLAARPDLLVSADASCLMHIGGLADLLAQNPERVPNLPLEHPLQRRHVAVVLRDALAAAKPGTERA